MTSFQEQLHQLIPSDFPDNSRVWIYQSSRPFSDKQTIEINEQLKQFYLQWQVHGAALKGWAGLLFSRFIIFMADESDFKVSGCSINSTERVLKSIEKQYDTILFDRLSITFLVKGKPETLPMNQVQYALTHHHIDGDTLLFNNLVDNRKDLLENWLQPLSQSWLAARVIY